MLDDALELARSVSSPNDQRLEADIKDLNAKIAAAKAKAGAENRSSSGVRRQSLTASAWTSSTSSACACRSCCSSPIGARPRCSRRGSNWRPSRPMHHRSASIACSRPYRRRSTRPKPSRKRCASWATEPSWQGRRARCPRTPCLIQSMTAPPAGSRGKRSRSCPAAQRRCNPCSLRRASRLKRPRRTSRRRGQLPPSWPRPAAAARWNWPTRCPTWASRRSSGPAPSWRCCAAGWAT